MSTASRLRPVVGSVPWPILVAGLVAMGVCSVAVPLLTYSMALAAFGLAHVLSELRYVDLRFGSRLGTWIRWQIAILLFGVVALRVLGIFRIFPAELRVTWELALVFLLAIGVIPILWRAGVLRGAFGAVIAGILLVGLLISPLHTLAVLAVLHNLTPLGFFAEALRGSDRMIALVVGGLLFVGVPMLIFTGIPHAALASVGLVSADLSILSTGPLSKHLAAYLHPAFHDAWWAQHAFSAAVFGQCMHYVAVIWLLPSIASSAVGTSVMPWPHRRAFSYAIGAIASMTFLLYVWDFGWARSIYGVTAAVHAWIEVPLLLLALVPLSLAGTTASRSGAVGGQ